MIKSKSIAVIAIASVLLGGGIGTYGVVKKNETKVAFAESGYIIDGDEAHENGFAKYVFEAGEKLEYRYPDKVLFRDVTKTSVVADAASFLHYNDGSLTALNQGVLIDLNDLNTGMLNYYNLSAYATLENQGGSYALETQGSTMYFKDFMWKIGETKYLLVSDEIVITMADDQKLEYEDYVELKYYNEGILLILSEDGAVRTVSSDCIATMENGMQVDLASRTVLAKENVLMSMEQMVIGSNDNIDVLSPIKAVKGEEKIKEEQIKIHIPTFEVIDGADGINGQQGIDGEKGKTGAEGLAGVNGMDGIHGEAGIAGENGTDGEDGTVGENGTAGENGTNGLDGLDGTAGMDGTHGIAGTNGTSGENGRDGADGMDGMEGNSGNHGNDGTEGASGMPGMPGIPGAPGKTGTSGRNGASGAPGAQGKEGNKGTNGRDGEDGVDGKDGNETLDQDNKDEAIALPTFTWGENPKVSSNSATFEVLISSEDATDTLIGTDDITITLLDARTGRELQRYIRSSSDADKFEFTLEDLSAETEYRVTVNGKYTVNNSEYEKPFLSKTFITSSLGLSFIKNYVTEDSLEFTVYKSRHAGEIDASMVLVDEKGNEFMQILQFDEEEDGTGIASVTFNNENTAGYEIQSNTLYYAYLTVTDSNNRTYKMLEKQAFMTLKKRPSLGMPVVVVNKAASVFDMQLEGVKDEDNGIQYFRYELYTVGGDSNVPEGSTPVKTMLISSNKVLPCEVTTDMRSQVYRLRVVASFYDNEKIVEIPTDAYSEPFSMTITGYPQVSYMGKIEPDSDISEDDDFTKHDRLYGTLNIKTNGSKIRIDEAHPLVILYKSSTGQIKQMSFTNLKGQTILENQYGDYEYDIPIDMNGLRANDDYLLTVWAWTDVGEWNNTGNGSSATDDTYSYMSIGNVIAKTAEVKGFKADMKNNPAASIGFSLRLTDGSTEATSAYEASTMDRILFNVYNGDKEAVLNKTAELVASKLITADDLDPEVFDDGSAANRNSVLGQALYMKEGDYFSLDEKSLGVNPEDIDGSYTIEISAIQDYTEYRNTFPVVEGTQYFTDIKAAMPPTWDEAYATDGFYVELIHNNEESQQKAGFSIDQYKISSILPRDAVVGIKVTSKYNNTAGLATRFDYYAFDTTVNENVTDAENFYTDIAGKYAAYIYKDQTAGSQSVPSAVFWFDDVNTESTDKVLKRGHKYYFSGRVWIGSHNQFFPDAYAENKDVNVMRSTEVDLPYLAPKFYFMQYSSDGAGRLVYHYWVESPDPEALNTDLKAVNGTIENETNLRYDAKGETMHTLSISSITTDKDVVVSVGTKSYEKDAFAPVNVIQQVYKAKRAFDGFYYTVTPDQASNRLTFTIKTDSGVNEPVTRLTAIRVNVWDGNLSNQTEINNKKKSFILPLAVATSETATAHLSYSNIADLVGNNIKGEVVALYDTNVSGMNLAQGSGETMLAIETVSESYVNATRYVVLEPVGHADITRSANNLAWDSLFTVTRQSESALQNKYLHFAYKSPLDVNYNNMPGVAPKTLDFSGGVRGTVLSGPNVVSTFKEIGEKTLAVSSVGGSNVFEIEVGSALPTVDLSLGNSYNIVTRTDGATVNWRIAGHEPLIDKNMMYENKMYIALYEVVNNSYVTLLSDGATSYTPANTTVPIKFDPVVVNKTTSSYSFEITGLQKNKTYAVSFYYYESLNDKNNKNEKEPLDYITSKPEFYSFRTTDSIVVQPVSVTYMADSYESKWVRIRFGTEVNTGYQVKYDLVKFTGYENGVEVYEPILDSKTLQEMGVISNTNMITVPYTEADFMMTPGLVKWTDSLTGQETFFPFEDENYYIKLTPVSLVSDSEALGDPAYIKFKVEAPKEPFFNVKATPGSDSVSFRITVTDKYKVMAMGEYKVKLTVRDTDNQEVVLSQTDTILINDVLGLDLSTNVYKNNAPNFITVKGLPSGYTVSLAIYSSYDMDNNGEYDLLEIDPDLRRKTVNVKPLDQDKTYDLGDMSMLSASGNYAAIYFNNSVGLNDPNGEIKSIVYAVTSTANGVATSTTHSAEFVLSTDSDNNEMLFIRLAPEFLPGKWYTVYVKFLDASGAELEEATFNYKG